MPLTRAQRKDMLLNKGLDPNTHDFDESTGDILEYQSGVPADSETPSEPVLSPPELSPAKSSTFTAVARGAAQSAFPTLAALGGGAVAAQAMPFAHVAPPYSEIGAGLIGALGAGYGASKLQEAVVPESVKQNLFLRPEDITEHPVASEVGGLAPSMLALNPVKSLQSAGRAAGLLGRAAKGAVRGTEELIPAELDALKRYGINTGVNVGTQAGLNIAEQMQGDQPFNYGELAKSAAIGGLLNEPTALGRKVFRFDPSFEGVPSRAQEEAARLAQFEAKLAEQTKARAANVATEPGTISPGHELPVGAGINPEGQVLNPGVARTREKLYPYGTEVTPGVDASRYENRPIKNAATSAENIIQQRPVLDELVDSLVAEKRAMENRISDIEAQNQRLFQGLGIEKPAPPIAGPPTVYDPNHLERLAYTPLRPPEDPIVARMKKESLKRAEDFKKAKVIDDIHKKVQSDIKISKLKKQQLSNILRNNPDISILTDLKTRLESGFFHEKSTIPEPVKTELGKEIYPDYTGNIEYDNLINTTKPLSEAERIQQDYDLGKYQEKSKSVEQFDKLEPEIKAMLARRGINPGQYRVEIKDAQGNSILGEKSKAPIAGLADVPNKTVSLGKEAGADTAYHEAGHVYLDELARDPANKELVSRAFAEVGHPELTADEFVSLNDAMKAGDPLAREKFIGAEEKLMDYIGFEGAKRKLSGEKSKEFFKDALARFGLGENPAQRRIGAKLEHDAPKGESILNAPSKIEVKGSVPQERSEGSGVGEEAKTSTSDSVQREEKSGSEVEQKPVEAAKTEEKPVEGKAQEVSRPQPDELSTKKPFFNFLTSVTDKVRVGKEGSKSHEIVSKAGRNYFDEKSQLEGRYGNSIQKTLGDYTPKEGERVYEYRWAKDNKLEAPFELSANEQKLNSELQPLIERPKLDATESGLLVKYGDEYAPGGVKKEGYLPNQLDPKVLSRFEKNPNSIEAKRDKRIWAEWLKKKGAENPEEVIRNWEMARRDYGDTGGPEFAALRKAEGYGLPWELMDKNPARAFARYSRRAAADISFFKNIQSKDDVRAALGIKNQKGELPKDVEGIDYIGSEENTQKMLKYVYGKTRSEFPRLEAFGRSVGSMIMGPGTAIRNLASMPPQMVGMDVGMRDAFKGLANIGKIKQEAFEQNVTRPSYDQFDRYGDYDNPDSVVNTFDKLTAFFRKWQGRDLSDKWEGEYLYAVGKEWVNTQQAKAQAGDNRAAKLLERVGNLVKDPATTNNPEDLKKMATGFVNVVRGSYGPQGLPGWALSGNIAPFVALNKYSIERWNNVYKDVITPAKNGDIGPLFKYTLAALLGGAGIEQLNEAISGRKGPDPSLKESIALWAKNGDPELLASKAIALAQLTAYAGIVGDMAKLGERAIRGKDLKYSNPLSYPAYTFATETIGSNFSQAIGAIRDGEDPLDTLAELVKTVGTQTIQGVRYATNRAQPEETGRKEEFADLRKYREATGKEIPAGEDRPDEFKNLASKKFKKSEDLTTAVKELPGLIQKAFEKAGNDPYRLKAELRKLKQNSYQSMPAPETQPLEFFEYLKYLRETQGEEKASARLAKFLTQRAVNQAKAQMVP